MKELEKAAGLRSSAESQRRSVRDMRSRVSSYEDDISRLKKDRENKKQELGILHYCKPTLKYRLAKLLPYASGGKWVWIMHLQDYSRTPHGLKI